MAVMRDWRTMNPEEAVSTYLNWEEGPLNEMGERCPWPWDPQQLVGAAMGQYHCPYCGGMQVAGIEHLDWSGQDDAAFLEGYAIAYALLTLWRGGAPIAVAP